MPATPWYEQYRTGIASIDHMHEEIYTLVNALYDDVLAKAPIVTSRPKIAKLTQLSLTHFDEEEADMKRTGYPDTATHSAAHQVFRDQLAGIQAQLKEGKQVTGDTLEIVRNYLTQHAKIHDMKLAKHLAASQGAKTAKG